jgi:signal peptidase II
MSHKYTLLLITVGVIVLCDQITKLYVDAVMLPHQFITVIENYFDITYVRNPGGAFGLFAQGQPWIVRPLLLGSRRWLYHYPDLPQHSARPNPGAPGLRSLSGARSALIDRLRFDEVIDFVDVHWSHYHWPAFNIADAAITVGVAILCWDLLFGKASKQ